MPLAEAGFARSDIKEDQRRDLPIRIGPTVQVVVGHLDVATAGRPALANDQASESVHALIDTGALESCIDDQLARKLGLPVIDRQQCSGVNGPSTHDVYMAFIDIPAIVYAQYGRFMGVHLALGGQPHHVLLGRTLLQTMVMIYDGARGSVTLAR
jgi:predicted aspartyl protease